MFVDHGLSITDMPSDPPPSPSAGYGAVLEWVTGSAWEMDEHVDLAIAIWRRQIDPLNYVPQSPKSAAAEGASSTPASSNSSGVGLRRRRPSSPAATTPATPQGNAQAPQPTQAKPAAEDKPVSKLRRTGLRRSPASSKTAPAPNMKP
jgi:hypothetical protein